MSSVIRAHAQALMHSQETRNAKRLRNHVWPARLRLTLTITGNDGQPYQLNRWQIDCATPHAVKAVKRYLTAAAKALDNLIVPDADPTADSDISDPAA